MIDIIKRLFGIPTSLPNGVLHRAHTTRYEDLCQ